MSSSVAFALLGLVVGLALGVAWVLSRQAGRHGGPTASFLRGVPGGKTGDAIADADRLMAYGIYDDALAVVESAIDEDPSRADLKFKALEILFVWGDRKKYLECASRYQRDLVASDDWDKACVMGSQLCPGERLFVDARGK